jgi:hypothetical protein
VKATIGSKENETRQGADETRREFHETGIVCPAFERVFFLSVETVQNRGYASLSMDFQTLMQPHEFVLHVAWMSWVLGFGFWLVKVHPPLFLVSLGTYNAKKENGEQFFYLSHIFIVDINALNGRSRTMLLANKST